MKEKLNLYYLGLASLFAAKSSDARYMLASVHAEPCKNDKGAYLNEPILLSTDNKEFFNFAKKKPTDPGAMVAIERGSGAVNLGMDNGTRYTVRVLDAKFPEWQRVIDPKLYQTGDKVNQMYMNAAYLKDLWPIIPKTNGKAHYLHACIGGPGTLVDDGRRFKVAPTLFYPDDTSEHEFFALIMPVSTRGTKPEIPSWLDKLN